MRRANIKTRVQMLSTTKMSACCTCLGISGKALESTEKETKLEDVEVEVRSLVGCNPITWTLAVVLMSLASFGGYTSVMHSAFSIHLLCSGDWRQQSLHTARTTAPAV